MTPVEQLVDAVDEILSALTPFTGFLDDAGVEARCTAVVAELCSDDDRLAAEACLTVMTLLWPQASPEDCGRGDWWTTPLGRLCARSLGTDGESVTQSVAAAMLGVTKGTVSQLVHRGTLDRHRDGGVLRASVLQRLGRPQG